MRNFLKLLKNQTGGDGSARIQGNKLVLVPNTDDCFRESVRVLRSFELKKGMTFHTYSRLGGLGVTCSPQDPRFVGSDPAEVDELFQDLKILSTSPPGGTIIWGFRV